MNYNELAASQSILKFLDYYDIRNDQGLPLDFKDHAYLWDIYKDFTPKQAVLKAAQIGMSTTVNIKCLWLAKNKGMDIIYSLPSAADIKDFVSGKTNRLIDNNPIFQQWVADKDSIEQKRVGNNVIYFKGTWTERAAIATPADLYISDETDRSKQDIVTQYKTRLQHSKFGWEWYFSNPSAPGHGVDKHWAESNQRHWFVKCEGCNTWQYLTFKHIQGIPAIYACEKCGKELNRRNGQWVRRWQNKEISGYWIPLLIVPTKSAQDILNKKKEYTEEQFTNFVLGQPYVGKGNVLTRQMFLQNLTDKLNPQDCRPIIGVDTGIGINVVVGNKHGMFYNNKTEDYEEVRGLMRRWPNAVCIIDQGGDIIGPRKLREEFQNRVFLCFFGKDRKNDELIRWSETDGTVIADRNKCMQLVIDELTEKRIPIYGSEAEWWDVMLEFLSMYRTIEDSDIGPPIFQWHKPSSGRVDYPFCFLYWRVGMDKFMQESSTFHEPKNDSFAFPGLEASPNNTTFLPKIPGYSNSIL